MTSRGLKRLKGNWIFRGIGSGRGLFEADFDSGGLRLVDLPWRAALDRTAELSRTHTAKLGTRALDVLHVASALELGARTFVTYDTRQAALAKAVGLKTLAP